MINTVIIWLLIKNIISQFSQQANFLTLFCNTPVLLVIILMPFDPLKLALSQGEVKCLIRSFINACCMRAPLRFRICLDKKRAFTANIARISFYV